MEATPTENKQTEPLLGVKHKKHKWSDSLSFQSRLMIVFGLLLVLVLTIQGTATYIISRNLLLNYIDEMMLNSAEGVAKEIDLYTSAVNSREIMRKTVYLVQNERAAFVARGTPVQIDILDNRGGKVYTTEEVNGTSHLPDAARKKILGTREGINEVNMDGISYRVAHQQIPGRNWVYVIKMAKSDFMQPVLRLRNMAMLLGLATLLATLIICIWLSKKFTGPIRELCDVMGRASCGDLSVRVKESGVGREFCQLGASFNGMLAQLGEMFNQFSTAGKGMLETSRLMKQVSRQQLQQAATARERVVKINGAMKSVSVRVRQAETASHEMKKAAELGAEALQTVMHKMEENLALSARGSVIMRQLDDNVHQINNLLEMINSISEQTRLLSLNASIEAARAGDLGRGFAVVADEVRKLADDTAEVTRQVALMATAIGGKSEMMGKQVQQADEMVRKGSEAGGLAKEAFDKIFDRVSVTDNYITEISRQVEDVAEGISAVVGVIQKIAGDDDNPGGEGGFSARELARLSQMLSGTAEKIKEHLNRFNSGELIQS